MPEPIEAAIRDLIAQDAATLARGENPPRRLIPHHAIKRDVIIAAYTKDFQHAIEQLRRVGSTDVFVKRLGKLAEKLQTSTFDNETFGTCGE